MSLNLFVISSLFNGSLNYIYTLNAYRYISKNLNIMKKVNIFCHSFQKVKPIYYMKTQNSVSENLNIT